MQLGARRRETYPRGRAAGAQVPRPAAESRREWDVAYLGPPPPLSPRAAPETAQLLRLPLLHRRRQRLPAEVAPPESRLRRDGRVFQRGLQWGRRNILRE